MAERRVIHVEPREGKWATQTEGTERAFALFETKEQAEDEARKRAKREGRGQVIIHKMDGTIETEYTYGDDPSPPRG